jgi:hypothetical protein
VPFAGKLLERDVSPGRWIADGLAGGSGSTVASLVPARFEACARVLHPAYRYDGDDDLEVTWAEVAAHNGTVAHPLVQWDALTHGPVDSQPPVWDDGPSEGHLPVALARRLAAVLARHTGTPEDCLFGRWDGFGYDLPTPDVPPRLLLRGGRDVVLVRGRVGDAVRNLAPEPHEQSANLWWPDDHAWCVVTDVDLRSSYVGGTASCIGELLEATDVEAAPAAPDDPVA